VFVGIEMLLNGWSLVMLSFFLPQAQDERSPAASAAGISHKLLKLSKEENNHG
jgi:hypothetical protein